MIIIGGDRHKVSFNDAYFFKMNKGVETLPYYDWYMILFIKYLFIYKNDQLIYTIFLNNLYL